jgi:hypothetical protein
MNHFGEQNGPFCDVKWAILKKVLDFTSFLYELFTVSRAFDLKKRAKNPAEFYGKFYLLLSSFREETIHQSQLTDTAVSQQGAPGACHLGTKRYGPVLSHSSRGHAIRTSSKGTIARPVQLKPHS